MLADSLNNLSNAFRVISARLPVTIVAFRCRSRIPEVPQTPAEPVLELQRAGQQFLGEGSRTSHGCQEDFWASDGFFFGDT